MLIIKKIAEEQPMHILNISKMSAVRMLLLLSGGECTWILDSVRTLFQADDTESVRRLQLTVLQIDDCKDIGKQYLFSVSGTIENNRSAITLKTALSPSFAKNMHPASGRLVSNSVRLSNTENAFSTNINLHGTSPDNCFRVELSRALTPQIAGSPLNYTKFFRSSPIQVGSLKSGDIILLENWMCRDKKNELLEKHRLARQELTGIHDNEIVPICDRVNKICTGLQYMFSVLIDPSLVHKDQSADISDEPGKEKIFLPFINPTPTFSDEIKCHRNVAMRFLAALEHADCVERELDVESGPRMAFPADSHFEEYIIGAGAYNPMGTTFAAELFGKGSKSSPGRGKALVEKTEQRERDFPGSKLPENVMASFIPACLLRGGLAEGKQIMLEHWAKNVIGACDIIIFFLEQFPLVLHSFEEDYGRCFEFEPDTGYPPSISPST